MYLFLKGINLFLLEFLDFKKGHNLVHVKNVAIFLQLYNLLN